MDNSKQSAFPIVLDAHDYAEGLTKLEAFTMAAMQGLMAQNDIHLMRKVADEKGVSANTAIEIAKATLSELSKHQ